MANLADFRAVVGIPSARKNNTTRSGVIDRGDFGYPNWAQVVAHMGDIMSGATSGSKLTLFHSNTVSATASGMTAITGATTSGLTFPNSGTCISLGVDLRNKGRFLGMKLTVPTASADSGVIACFLDHPQSPPTSVSTAQQRFPSSSS